MVGEFCLILGWFWHESCVWETIGDVVLLYKPFVDDVVMLGSSFGLLLVLVLASLEVLVIA